MRMHIAVCYGLFVFAIPASVVATNGDCSVDMDCPGEQVCSHGRCVPFGSEDRTLMDVSDRIERSLFRQCVVLLIPLTGEYTGECQKGLAHGNGRAAGSDEYKGQFSRGLPDGFGTYEWSDGRRYKGNFQLGRPHGSGTLWWPNGKRYEGAFSGGLPNGKGKLFLSNGVLIGTFFGDTWEGTIVGPAGQLDGTWKKGRLVGRGLLRRPDGITTFVIETSEGLFPEKQHRSTSQGKRSSPNRSRGRHRGGFCKQHPYLCAIGVAVVTGATVYVLSDDESRSRVSKCVEETAVSLAADEIAAKTLRDPLFQSVAASTLKQVYRRKVSAGQYALDMAVDTFKSELGKYNKNLPHMVMATGFASCVFK